MKLTFILFTLICFANADASTISADDVRCDVTQVTLGVDLVGEDLIATRAAGIIPVSFDSALDSFVSWHGLGGIFKIDGQDRYLIDLIVCARPGPSGFPPNECFHRTDVVRIFQRDEIGLRHNIRFPFGGGRPDEPMITVSWADDSGYINMQLCRE